MSISSEQIRGARGLLGISQKELAEAAGMSHNSLNNIERGVGHPRPDTLDSIRRALEHMGVDFIESNGVRMTGELFKIKRIEGADILFRLYEDILKTAGMKPLDEVLYHGIDNMRFGHTEPGKLDAYKSFERELTRRDVGERLLFKDGDTTFLSDRNCYRWLPPEFCSEIPMVIYDINVALMPWGPPQRLAIIRNAAFAESMRHHFNALWSMARPVPDETHLKYRVRA